MASAAPSAPLAKAADPPPPPPFDEAIDYVFQRWTALNLAVDHGWGGDDSAEKREDLIDEVLAFAEKRGSALYREELQGYLEDFFVDEFNCQLEDGSAFQVADMLVKLWEERARGERTLFDAVKEKAVSASGARESVRVRRPDDEADSDSSDGGSGGDGGGADTAATAGRTPSDAMDTAAAPSADAAAPSAGPDADGWVTVTRRGRK